MPRPFTHKPQRAYAAPVHDPKERPRFETLPRRTNINLTLPLSAVDTPAANRVDQSGKLVFHCVGDTGGVHGTGVQTQIAKAMISQFQFDPNTRQPTDSPDNPAFFYHLGDVVYYNGVSADYPNQFYDPYKMYPAVIFAIPGNHDGDTHTHPNDPPDPETSLYGFIENFCDTQPHQASDYRDTITQPYVYWTLDTSQATLIGLYGNIDGMLDAFGTIEQQAWLQSELSAADPNKCLILSVHQPPYSLDTEHGGYPYIGDAIDRAATGANRWPDVVLSAHVHDYQRFTREVTPTRNAPGVPLPYVVAGAGGYAIDRKSMHKLARADRATPVPVPLDMPDYALSLRAYNEYDPGFLRLTVQGALLTYEYFSVPLDGPPLPVLFDSIQLNWQTKQLTENTAPLPSAPDPNAA